MFKILIMLDVIGFAFRRFVRMKLHIKMKDVYLTVLLVQCLWSITKTIVKYIRLSRRNSVNKPTKCDTVATKYPHLRIVK